MNKESSTTKRDGAAKLVMFSLIMAIIVMMIPATVLAATINVPTSMNLNQIRTAVLNARDGDVVQFAAGTYPALTQMNINYDVTFKGAGVGETILSLAASQTAIFRLTTTSGNSPEKFSAEDITFVGPGAGRSITTDGNLVFDEFTIKNCEIKNFQWGIYFGDNATAPAASVGKLTLENVNLHDNTHGAMYSGKATTVAVISNCKVENNGNSLADTPQKVGIQIWSPLGEPMAITVSNTDFINNGNGTYSTTEGAFRISFGTPTATASSVEVTGCAFVGNSAAINVNSAVGSSIPAVTVTDSKFEDNTKYDLYGRLTDLTADKNYAGGGAPVINPASTGSVVNTTFYTDPEMTDLFTVIPATGVSLDQIGLVMPSGTNATLSATVAPVDAFNKNVTWSSDSPSVATVDATGIVTAVGTGVAVITARTVDGSFTKSCTVIVTEAPKAAVTGLTFARPYSTKMITNGTAAQKSQTLAVALMPEENRNPDVIWYSTNESVATVDDNGVVKALRNGTVKIVAQSLDNKALKATATITVTTKVTSVKLSKTNVSIKKGKSYTLIATVAPTTASNKAVTWTSNGKTLVKVSKAGVVTVSKKARAGKKYTIAATTVDGKFVKKCTVTVK